ncbi:MAG: hypothetical protein JXA18_12500, partial [Chitinispirillaceae bacterium]|nr:hypothetical protein [Chitinispirillaceae bacterium]
GMNVSGLTPTYTIGVIDESKMELMKMINDVAITTQAGSPASVGRRAVKVGMSAHPIIGSGIVFLDVNLPDSHIGREAAIEIFDARGALVRKLTHKVSGSNNQLSWDLRDGRGASAARGTYVVRLSCGSTRLASRFSIFS